MNFPCIGIYFMIYVKISLYGLTIPFRVHRVHQHADQVTGLRYANHNMLSKILVCFYTKIKVSFAGYKSLGRLRNLEILDFTSNKFNKSIFPYLSSATSLTTLFLRDNHMDGPFPAKGIFCLIT